MTTTIHLSGPADVLTVLPYQLGFHPHDCLVTVSLHGTRMGLVQRIDLPPPEHVREAVAAMIGPLRQDRPRSVLLIGFEEREAESRAMLNEMAGECLANDVEVTDRIVVRGGRWFDLDCTRSCCPPEGLALPDPSEVPAVAEFVGREICPLPDRLALADLLEPSPLMSQGVAPLADEWLKRRSVAAESEGAEQDPCNVEHDARNTALHEIRARELAVWARVLHGEDEAEPISALPWRDLAILAVSLTDVDLRDGLIAWLCPGALPQDVMDPNLVDQMSRALLEPSWLGGSGGGTRRAEVEQVIGQQRIERRLCELCAALPDVWAVSALTLLAAFTWWRGDGALTRIALDRALRVDPHYRLAQLLERMVDLAIRPEKASA